MNMQNLNAHFQEVLRELGSALARAGAQVPIDPDGNAVATLGDAVAVAQVVNDEFFSPGQGVSPEEIAQDTVKELARRIVMIQAGQL